ncbi:YufK family protein [Shouchella shacheensis]|uniref:YufK family protein n=1 Tax=Shouchella shacheensis TaxID=1649580 RepID=UPI00073FE0C4|nr:YufK family protein [Shouchella shacheensis]
MTNRYLTGHLPLFSILLFSLSFSLYGQSFMTSFLEEHGIYGGMVDFFSENGIRLALLFVFMLAFFMLFSALKLIADTIFSLSMLFFSKDDEGGLWQKVRSGTWIYLGASGLSLVAVQEIFFIVAIFLAASLGYLLYVIYKIADALTVTGLIGFVSFHLLFWATFIFSTMFIVIRLYNSFIASLPL